MLRLRAEDPKAIAIVDLIHSGKVEELRRMLAGDGALARALIIDAKGCGRTLLHIVTDWPGHFHGPAAPLAS